MDTEKESSLLKDANLRIIFSITLMAVMGVASISPVFPKIIDVFSIDKEHVAWLVTVFTVPGIVLTPLMGVVADRIGRKRVMIPSLFLFAIAGTACAFAPDFYTLVILRFFQGVGAASIGSLNVTLIGDIFQGKRRAQAMGYNASVLSIGTASYPFLGGALAMFGWNYPFLFPVLAVPVGIWALVGLKNPEPKNSENFWKYLKNAFGNMKDKKVIGIFVLSTATFIILYGSYIVVFPLFLENRFEANALHIGLMMSGVSISTAITSSQLGKLSRRFKPATLITIGFVFYAISLFLIPTIHNFILILIPAIIFGVAQGLNLPASQTLLSSLASIEHRAAFMSVNGMVLRLGQTIGPVLLGFIMSGYGMPVSFIFSGILALLMAGFAQITLKHTV